MIYKPLTDWFWKRIATDSPSTPLDLPAIAKEAAAIFATDPDFIRAMIYPIIYDQFHRLVGYARDYRRMNGDAIPTTGDAKLIDTAARKAPLLYTTHWFENVAAGKSIRITEMTRPLLRDAISMRHRQLQGEWRMILCLEYLVTLLKDDKQKLGKVKSLKEIEDIYRRFKEGKNIPAYTPPPTPPPGAP